MTKPLDDAKVLCAALNRFGLPRAMANLQKDCFLAWNASFQRRTGFTGEALNSMGFSEIVEFGPAHNGDDQAFRLYACSVRCAHGGDTVLGTLVHRPDGYVYLMLDVVQPEESAFEHGRWVGSDQQRARCERALQEEAGPKLLAGAEELDALQRQLEARQLDTGSLVRAREAFAAAFETLRECLRADEP